MDIRYLKFIEDKIKNDPQSKKVVDELKKLSQDSGRLSDKEKEKIMKKVSHVLRKI